MRCVIESLEQRRLLAVTFSTLAKLNGSDGSSPFAGVIVDAAHDLFGVASAGGANHDGTIYEVVAGSSTATVLATFNGSNGAQPSGGLIRDAAGDLFGTTTAGGTNGSGTIFKLVAGAHTPTTLVNLNGTNGDGPDGNLVADGAGNFYGTTRTGGANSSGTIFKLAAGTHAFSTLASFEVGSNGYYPTGTLLVDSSGNLFGTTYYGGADNGGNVFELHAGSHTPTELAEFSTLNPANGQQPRGGLVADSSGNLYGTTDSGGNFGDGVIYKVAEGTHALSVIYNFDDGNNGGFPEDSLLMDAAGNLFGTTNDGGASNGFGTVFKLARGGTTPTTLVTFNGSSNGAAPWAGLFADASGNLFGTTSGSSTASGDKNGTVFELSGSGFVVPSTVRITVTAPAAQAAVAGPAKLFTLGSFAQTGGATAPYSIDVHWGDGSADTVFSQSSVGTITAKSHTFTKATADSVSVTVTDARGHRSNTGSFTVTVSAAAAAKLVFTTQPTNTQAGKAIMPAIVVDVEDAFGNVVTTSSASITLGIKTGPSGAAALTGTTTLAAHNGVASLSGIVLKTAGAYTLKGVGGLLAQAASSSFTITPASASKLVFVKQPSNISANHAISPAVKLAVEDAFGNVVTSNTSRVTLSIASSPRGGALSGVDALNAVAGIATFSDLLLNPGGTYTLKAVDGVLTGATSHSFTVV
jgi:uncharacterized repeat protein (TIGR03803 family)